MGRLRGYSIELILVAILGLAVAFFGYLGWGLINPGGDQEFSGERALALVADQMAYGPRTAGSEDADEMGDWLIAELRSMGWDVVIQPFPVTLSVTETVSARNIIAIRGDGGSGQPVALLGTHYDTRLAADADPEPARRQQPVPGANGGGSGVAVLLELARTLDVAASQHVVCLAFFDAEDNRGLPGWQEPLGSARFLMAQSDIPRCANPRFAVLIDAVGGREQRIALPTGANPGLSGQLWRMADALGYGESIVAEVIAQGPSFVDAFLEAGIPTVAMIDTGYPYWHTTLDTADKLSASSLARIGQLMELWLEQGAPFTEP